MRDEHGAPERRPAGLLEDEVLAALWAAGGPASPAQVQEALGGELAYTTVMTTLGRLFRKGLAVRERAGRGFVYTAAVDEAAHTAQAMNELLLRRSDRSAVLARFAAELSADDREFFERLLKDAPGEAQDGGDGTPD